MERTRQMFLSVAEVQGLLGMSKSYCYELVARLNDELEKMGFETLPSLANFIFTRCPQVEGGRLYRELKARGVLVRHWDKAEIADWCRVTIGSRGQMDVFLEKVREIVKEAAHADS